MRIRYYYPELKTTANKEVMELPIEVMKFEPKTYKALTYLSKSTAGGVSRQKFETVGDLVNYGKNNMWKMFGNFLSYDETCFVFADMEAKISKVGLKLKDSEFEVGNSSPLTLDVSERIKKYIKTIGIDNLDDLVINYSRLIRALPGDRTAIVEEISNELQQVGLKFDRKKFVLDKSKVFDPTKFLLAAEKFRKNPEIFRENYSAENVYNFSESTHKTQRIDMSNMTREEILTQPVINFGLTKKFRESFQSIGIKRIGDLIKLSEVELSKAFSVYNIRRIKEELTILGLSLASNNIGIKKVNLDNGCFVYEGEIGLEDFDKEAFLNKTIESPTFPPKVIEKIRDLGKYTLVSDFIKAPTSVLRRDLGDDVFKSVKLVMGCYGFKIIDQSQKTRLNARRIQLESILSLPENQLLAYKNAPLSDFGLQHSLIENLESLNPPVKTVEDLSLHDKKTVKEKVGVYYYNTIITKLRKSFNVQFKEEKVLNETGNSYVNKTFNQMTEDEKSLFIQLPLSKIGFRGNHIKELNNAGIFTVLDLMNAPSSIVRKAYSGNLSKCRTCIRKLEKFGLKLRKQTDKTGRGSIEQESKLPKARKSDLELLDLSQVSEKVKGIKLENLGFEKFTYNRLYEHGIYTIEDLARQSKKQIRDYFKQNFNQTSKVYKRLEELQKELSAGELKQEITNSVEEQKVDLNLELTKLGLAELSIKHLNNSGIYYLGELIQYTRTEIRQILKSNNKATEECFRSIESIGLDFSTRRKQSKERKSNKPVISNELSELGLKQNVVYKLNRAGIDNKEQLAGLTKMQARAAVRGHKQSYEHLKLFMSKNGIEFRASDVVVQVIKDGGLKNELSDIGLPQRAVYNLKQSGIETISQVSKLTKTEFTKLIKQTGLFLKQCYQILEKNNIRFCNSRPRDGGYSDKQLQFIKEFELNNEILQTLKVSPKTVKNLKDNGIETIAALTKLTKTEARRAILTNEDAYKKLYAAMRENGLEFSSVSPVSLEKENGLKLDNELTRAGVLPLAAQRLKSSGIENIDSLTNLGATELSKLFKGNYKYVKNVKDVLFSKGLKLADKRSERGEISKEYKEAELRKFGIQDNELYNMGMPINIVVYFANARIKTMAEVVKLSKTEAKKIMKNNDKAYKQALEFLTKKGLSFRRVVNNLNSINSVEVNQYFQDNELYKMGLIPSAVLSLKDAGIETLSGLIDLTKTDLRLILKGNKKRLESVGDLLKEKNLSLKSTSKVKQSGYFKKGEVVENELTSLGINLSAARKLKSAGIETVEQLKASSKSKIRKIVSCYAPSFNNIIDVMRKNGIEFIKQYQHKNIKESKQAQREKEEQLILEKELSEDLRKMLDMGFSVISIGKLYDAGIKTLEQFSSISKMELRKILKQTLYEQVIENAEKNGIVFKEGHRGKPCKYAGVVQYIKENEHITKPQEKSSEEKIAIMKSDISHLDLPNSLIGALREKNIFNVYELMNYSKTDIANLFGNNISAKKVIEIALFKEGLTLKYVPRGKVKGDIVKDSQDRLESKTKSSSVCFNSSRVEIVDYHKLSNEDKDKFRHLPLSTFGVPEAVSLKLRKINVINIWDLVTKQKSKVVRAIGNIKYLNQLEDIVNSYGLQLNGSRSSFKRVKKPTTFEAPRLFIFSEKKTDNIEKNASEEKLSQIRKAAEKAVNSKKFNSSIKQENNSELEQEVTPIEVKVAETKMQLNALDKLKADILTKGLDALYDLPDSYFVEDSKELDELRVFMVEWFLDKIDVMVLGAGSSELIDKSVLHISRQKEEFENIIKERLIKTQARNEVEEKRKNAASIVRDKIMNSMGKFKHEKFNKDRDNVNFNEDDLNL